MEYKLIASDVDGTLLNSKFTLTDTTRKAILETVESGALFVISTGRPIVGAQFISDLFDEDLPFITYNGAVVIMGKSRRRLYEQNLECEMAKQIVADGRNYGATVVVWANDNLYAFENNEKIEEYKKISGVEPIIIKDLTQFEKSGVTKVLWYDDIAVIGQHQADMQEKFAGKVNCHTSRPMFLEFVDARVSKAAAMEELGKHYGILPSEMIAVGGGFNDVSMLEYAGLGVAMGNAPQAVKDKADYITLSNDQDGLAHVIDKFILKKI